MTWCVLKIGKEVIHLKTDILQSKRYIDKRAEVLPYRIEDELDSRSYCQVPPYHWWPVRVSTWTNFHISYFSHAYEHASGSCLTCGLNFDGGPI